MIATTAKLGGTAGLKELLADAGPSSRRFVDMTEEGALRMSADRFRAEHALQLAASDLGRLVLTLSAELRDVIAVYAPGHETCHGGCAAASAQEALAAVEEL